MLRSGTCWRCMVRLNLPYKSKIIRYYSITPEIQGSPRPRIIFFGSDTFSCRSLVRLYEAQKKNPNLYESLEVVTREASPSGRGLVREKLPVQRLVERINLPFQTVTKESIANLQLKADLLITCSFGLMIPAKLIENASYTVNVHPSLLPQYRGPAPIYHSILNGDRHTGVSLQTLHPKKFDEGIIFDQSYPVPIEENETFLNLWDRLALKGAEMLLNCVQNRTYQHPTPIQTFTEPSYASMVTKQIDWYKITAVEASRLARCVDPITGVITLDEGKRSFVHLRGVKVREKGSAEQPGHYFLPKHAESRKNKLCVVCKDRTTVWVDEVKVSGKDWIDGVEFFSSAPDRFWGQRFTPWRKEFEDHDPSEFEF